MKLIGEFAGSFHQRNHKRAFRACGISLDNEAHLGQSFGIITPSLIDSDFGTP